MLQNIITHNKISMLLAFAAILLMPACEREWNNPWDENADPEDWAPSSLQIKANSLLQVTLFWQHNGVHIVGYKIDRKVNDSTWMEEFAIVPESQNSFTDNEVNLMTSEYRYRIFAYGNQIQSTKTEAQINKIEIGNLIFGGIVFYLNSNGTGLVCTKNDLSTNSKWGCYSTKIGGTSFVIGKGAENTYSIVSGCSQSDIAARICGDLILENYDDWFLPSTSILGQIYFSLKLAGVGNFENDYYWSSYEWNGNSAWCIDFSNGHNYFVSKDSSFRVRAVRAF